MVSGPSGAGKSTVLGRVLAEMDHLRFSVSYTTRARRADEADGRDYHFVDRVRFEAMVAEGALLEWANVFGQLYGTGITATRKVLEARGNLLLDIDVQGARQVRQSGASHVSIMLLPPDFAALEERLRARGSESEAELGRRLARAREEANDYRYFDYLVVNEDVEATVTELEAIVRAEGRRTARCTAHVQRILASFPTEGRAIKE